MKPGRTLELLVAALEQQLSGAENTTVESPKRLRDTVTGCLREHDVVLTLNQGHHEFLVAFECKDHRRPLGVPVVEAFAKKCEHTQVSRGVLVSTSGFTSSAQQKAGAIGIRCIDLPEVHSTDWLAEDAVAVVHNRVFQTAKYSYVVYEPLNGGAEEWNAFAPDNTPVTNEMIRANVHAHADAIPWVAAGTEASHSFSFATDGFFLRNRARSLTVPLREILVELTYTTEVTEVPLAPKAYLDIVQDKVLAQFAATDVSFGDQHHQLALVATEAGTTLTVIPSFEKVVTAASSG